MQMRLTINTFMSLRNRYIICDRTDCLIIKSMALNVDGFIKPSIDLSPYFIAAIAPKGH